MPDLHGEVTPNPRHRCIVRSRDGLRLSSAFKSNRWSRREASDTGEHSLKRVLGPLNLADAGRRRHYRRRHFRAYGMGCRRACRARYRPVLWFLRASHALSPGSAVPSLLH